MNSAIPLQLLIYRCTQNKLTGTEEISPCSLQIESDSDTEFFYTFSISLGCLKAGRKSLVLLPVLNFSHEWTCTGVTDPAAFPSAESGIPLVIFQTENLSLSFVKSSVFSEENLSKKGSPAYS